MTKVLLLGSSGMLGHMFGRVFAQNLGLEVTATTRQPNQPETVKFDAARDSIAELLDRDDYEWIVNAIGMIKPRIDESDPASIKQAIDVNAAFPQRLSEALRPGQRTIQIATDGVFSGLRGAYDETASADASDAYATTKSAGEVASPSFVLLRCSIIGPERESPRSLLGWLLSQPQGSSVPGYTNHRWNGITTLHFAKLSEAVVTGEMDGLPSPMHVVPADSVSKAELLRLALDAFGRDDIEVSSQPADHAIDRTLATRHPEANRRLWSAAGYDDPPTIAAMIEELAGVPRPRGG